MIYTVRTIDRCFTEAQYDSLEQMVAQGEPEIMAGTRYFMVTAV